MKTPFLTEAVADMILRCLNAGGYLPNAADIDTIRNVSLLLDEAQRDALAIGFTYGGGGGGGSSDRLTSPTDCWVLLDNDNTNGTTPYTNYFSIIKGQSSTPATDPKKMVFSIGAQSGPDRSWVDASFGPRLDQVGVSDDMGSVVSLGAGGNGVSKWTYGALATSKVAVVLQSHLSNTVGMLLQGGNILGLGANEKVVVTNHASGNTRGGFFNVNTHYRFGLGSDFQLSPTDNCLMLEKYSDGSLLLYTPDVVTERSFYVFGNYNGATDLAAKWVHLSVGGQPGVTGQDPTNVPIEGSWVETGHPGDSHLNNHSATLLAVSPNRGGSAFSAALQTWHRATTLPDYATLVNHHTSLDLDGASEKIRLFSISGLNDDGLRTVVMATRADRTTWAYALRSFTSSTGGLDVAEYFDTDQPTNTYSPGTVMVASGNGKVVPSNTYAAESAVGAVSTKPGVMLGAQCNLNSKEDPTKDLFVPVAMAGTIPVRVSISHGEIDVGSLLVSAEGGLAAKAPNPPVPGTVIGKALEPWLSAGEGKIKMLVLNR